MRLEQVKAHRTIGIKLWKENVVQRISSKTLLTTVVCLAIMLTFAGAAMLQGATPSESNKVLPNTTTPGLRGFYGLPEEQTNFLKNIVLNDSVVKALLDNSEYEYRLDVGCWLTKGMNEEKFFAWMEGGRTDTGMVSEYVGVIYIGYNKMYTFSIDISTQKVINLVAQPKQGPQIPEITKDEKSKAISLALNEPHLKTMLEGKNFEISNNDVGIWHTTLEEGNGQLLKIGAVVQIRFAHTYNINSILPNMVEDRNTVFGFDTVFTHYEGPIDKLLVFISLSEERVIEAAPQIMPKESN